MARSFNGTNQKVQLANEANFDFDRLDTHTVSIWFNYTTHANFSAMFGRAETGTFRGFLLLLNNVIGALAYHLDNNNNINDVFVTYGAGQNDGVWRHVIVTYSGTSNAAGILPYINNVLQVKTVLRDTLTMTILTNNQVACGEYNNQGLGDFNGNLAMLGVFNNVAPLNVNQSLSSGIPNLIVNDGNKVTDVPLWGNSDPEPDYTSSANIGTVTGATRATTNPPVEHIENYL